MRKISTFGFRNLTGGKDRDAREAKEKEKIGKESGSNQEVI
jgi:hypothetical protein